MEYPIQTLSLDGIFHANAFSGWNIPCKRFLLMEYPMQRFLLMEYPMQAPSLSPQTRYIVPILDGREVQKAVLLYFGATTKPKKIRTLCYSKPSDFPCFVLLPNQNFLPVGLQGKHKPQCKRQKCSVQVQVQLQMQMQVEVQVRKCK